MLDVALKCLQVAAMLIGIEVTEVTFRLDSLNGPTCRPIPEANGIWELRVRLTRV